MSTPCASPIDDSILTVHSARPTDDTIYGSHGALCAIGRTGTPKPFPPPIALDTYDLVDSDDYFLLDEDGLFLEDSIL